MFQFISVGESFTIVFRILVLFRRDIKRKYYLFYSGTDSFKARNMDKLSIDYFIY